MNLLFEKPKHHHRQSEFQAVILAGYGSSNRLYPISEDDNLPKALLPVGNKPMIAYTLEWLEKAGVYDAIVLIQSVGNAQQKLSGYLSRNYNGSVHCNVVAVDEDLETAEALRSIKNKIDVTLFYEPSNLEAGNKDDGLSPYVGIEPKRNALVYKANRSDDEDFSMRMSLLTKFPRVRIHTDLQDAHLYIFKRWVIDMLADKENIASISEDLVPMLVKCQYQKKMLERENVHQCK
ncbi:nucleotide-diphospho-sugar transferase [Cunninghamella echinulata]|nr:nucleotide-diphospho-sugar transferase [Cunninghamella echinulata]